MTWARQIRWLPVLAVTAIVLSIVIAIIIRNWALCSLDLVIGAVALSMLVGKE